MLLDLRMLKSNMVDNLDSTSNEDFLSANMGRELNSIKLDKLLRSYELIVDSINGNDSTADGTELKPFRTISAAYNYLPDFVKTVTIKIKDGTYIEESSIQLYKNIVNLTIESFSESNPNVTISCNSSDNRDSLIYISNSHKINLKNLKFTRSGNKVSGSCINIDCVNFDIDSCVFENAYCGIISSCCNGQINNCNFDSIVRGITANKASNILSTNNNSLANVEYGIVCNGSIVFNYGNNLKGTVEDYVTTLYGRVFNTSREVAVATIYNDTDGIIERGNTSVQE